MPSSPTHHHNNESDNEFSSANENSNLSEINPHVLNTPATLLRQAASQLSVNATAFSQNSSSSTSSYNASTGNSTSHNICPTTNQNANSSSSTSSSRKFRHQNFSKNIYIGTKNAERWDNLRNLFQFKNDVEFVSFLLTTAENEAHHNKNGFKLPKFHKENSQDQSSASLNSFRQQQTQQQQQQQQQQQSTSDNNKQLLHHQQQISKKVKRVKFQEDVNVINNQTNINNNQDNSLKLSSTTNENNAQDHSISSTIDGSVTSEESNNTTEILDCRIAEKIKNEIEEKKKMLNNNGRIRYDEAPTPPPISSSLMDKQVLNENDIEDDDDDENDVDNDEMNDENIRPVLNKRRFYDIRKTPTMLDVKLSEMSSESANQDKSVFDFKDDDEDDDCEGRLEINSDFMIRDRKMSTTKKVYKSKMCYACNTKHGKEICPVKNPISSIPNQIDFSEWIQDHPIVEPPVPTYDNNDAPLEDDKMFYEESIKSENELDDLDDEGEEDDEPEDNKPLDLNPDHSNEFTFAEASLPNEFEFLSSLTYPNCNRSIFTKIMIPKYTQIGPLVGVVTPESEISDDSNMCYIFEIHDSILMKSIYFNMENKQKSNWIRYLQPAKARDQRNLTLVKVEDKIYFVSCVDINPGCELLYWSDDVNSAWSKKKIDKTNCGGCNIRFEHPIHYRTHCSVFHDPGFSLTIRKYHCKVCGVPVLGKENIMKHAEKLHNGKGAYQCQYCRKFFLRLNYLEMHRTYGCSLNPKRTRPLCDFCGRKFCQPQKLKIHIKRMHSDMAEVLRDFQCKLCSKLLGSRAALQRHSKEVHSRNSAVVSCPRCQKLFQNRSNLKIHMLTHSGVRPFKCSENECTAAFTTKQCLQFHYKKVHGYTQEQMPKIERSVAYTFDAYSGDHVTQIPEQIARRQRKSTSSTDSIGKSNVKKEISSMKEKNFLSSISDLCKGENNLELLSSKITSILNCNLKEMNKKLVNNPTMDDMDMENDGNNYHENDQFCENMNSSDMESKMIVSQNMRNLLQQNKQLQQRGGIVGDESITDSISCHDTNDMEHDDEMDDERESFKTPINRRGLLVDNPQLSLTSNPRLKDFLLQANQNLVMSKGSKKWISDSVQMNGGMSENEAAMAQANRDFLAKLISSKLHKGRNVDEEHEHPEDLEIHHSHHSHHQHQQQQQQQQTQEQENDQFNDNFDQSTMAQNNNMMEIQSQYQQNNNANSGGNSNVFNSHFNPLGGFYNANSNTNRNISGSIPTSASLLVEAALSSVSSMIGNSDLSENGNQQMTMDENEGHQQDLPDEMTSQDYQSHDMMDENMKMMKNPNFPVHLPSISSFSSNVNANIMRDNNEIEVDASSTPKPHEKMCEGQHVTNYQTQGADDCSPARTMTPDQHNSNYSGNFSNQRNPQVAQIQTSPAHLTVRPIYSSEHELASPASTPSLPRYDFSSENYRRREKNMSTQNIHAIQQQQHQSQQQTTTQIAHMSSDEENSIVIAENLSVNHQQSQNQVVNDKIKLNSQVDLLYANSKYDNSLQNSSNQISRESLNDLRLKYNNEQNLDVQEFSRNSAVVNDNVVGNGSNYQGLDMSSRASIGYHSHNFPTGSNLSFNRYQHHIYDILTDREQQIQHQPQQEHHPFQLHQPQQQQQQIQHLLQDHISQQHEQDSDQIQSGVDLSRTSNYIVPSPPPHLQYSHTHSEMLRMASLDLSSSGSNAPNIVSSNNSHHVRHHSSFLSHSANRELTDHHRFLSAADQRLLVDPTTHLLIEQNNRLLSSENNRILDQSRLLTEGPSNRHVVSPRGFGAYHHHPHHSHHSQMKYHQGPSGSQQQNYHPFSATYY